MGNQTSTELKRRSKPPPTSSPSSSQLSEKEIKKILSKHGILIPPTFGVGTDSILPPSSISSTPFSFDVFSLYTNLASKSTSSNISSILENDSSIRLLSLEHLQLGLYTKTTTPSYDGSVLASYNLMESKGAMGGGKIFFDNDENGDGEVVGGVGLSAHVKNDEKKGRGGGGGCNGAVFVRNVKNGVNLYTSFSSDTTTTSNVEKRGNGVLTRVGMDWRTNLSLPPSKSTQHEKGEYYKNDPFSDEKMERSSSTVNLCLGTSAILNDPKITSSLKTENDSVVPNTETVHALNAHASISIPTQNMIAAIEADVSPQNISSSTKWKPTLSYLLSIDLNATTSSSPQSTKKPKGPPTMITLHKRTKAQSKSEMAATIGQSLSFHRTVLNLYENRCPKIRNIFSWAVQMRHVSEYNKTSLRSALAWQMNRNIAFKVLSDSNEGLKCGLLLKHWAEPRVTCSLLFGTLGTDGALFSGIGFQGVGIQLETGPLPKRGSSRVQKRDEKKDGWDDELAWLYYGDQSKSENTAGDVTTPATRAELPREWKDELKR